MEAALKKTKFALEEQVLSSKSRPLLRREAKKGNAIELVPLQVYTIPFVASH